MKEGEKIVVDASGVRKVGAWLVGLFLAAMAMQTVYLRQAIPDQDQVAARQDSIHQRQVQMLAAFAELVATDNRQRHQAVIDYLEAPVLTEFAELREQVQAVAATAGRPHISPEDLHRTRLELIYELRQLDGKLKSPAPTPQDTAAIRPPPKNHQYGTGF